MLKINWSLLKNSQNIDDRLDYWKFVNAQGEKYGQDDTVQNFIDSMIEKGYNHFELIIDGNLGRLMNGSKVFNLFGRVQCDYAEMITRRIKLLGEN